MEDIADPSANDLGDIVDQKNSQPLAKGKIIKIEFLSGDFPLIYKINQSESGAGIKNR